MRKNVLFSVLIIALFVIIFLCWKAYPILRLRFLVPPTPPDLTIARVPAQQVTLTTPVPILMYHHIATVPDGGNSILFVSPEHFKDQLRWLAENGYQTVGLDDLRRPSTLPRKPIILTFDDGYQDAYDQALPILEQYDFRGTFYLVTNDLDKLGFLDEAEIIDMTARGMRFGSHTLSHPDLTAITPAQAAEEVYGSTKLLERILGISVTDFCYPGGLYDPSVETTVMNSGYTTATTTVDDTNTGTVDPFTLSRIPVHDDTDLAHLPTLNTPWATGISQKDRCRESETTPYSYYASDPSTGYQKDIFIS